jgi:hypothetical protein
MTTYTPIRPYQARASRLANEIVAAMITNRPPPREWFAVCEAADREDPPSVETRRLVYEELEGTGLHP